MNNKSALYSLYRFFSQSHPITRYQTHRQKHIKTSLVAIAMLSCLSSPMVYADEIGNLIKLKTQAYPQVTFSNPSISTSPFIEKTNQHFYSNYAAEPNIEVDYIDTLYTAEQNASPAGKQVLMMVRQMALDNKEIIKGSCWDYLNEAFSRAGVGRNKVFTGEYPYGPFVDTNEIQPGDWLYYVNHSYNDVEHSGLFVGWLNREANQALILSYAGERRQEPARYKSYDVSHTYNIIRPSF